MIATAALVVRITRVEAETDMAEAASGLAIIVSHRAVEEAVEDPATEDTKATTATPIAEALAEAADMVRQLENSLFN